MAALTGGGDGSISRGTSEAGGGSDWPIFRPSSAAAWSQEAWGSDVVVLLSRQRTTVLAQIDSRK
jgi:hypothetical protein